MKIRYENNFRNKIKYHINVFNVKKKFKEYKFRDFNIFNFIIFKLKSFILIIYENKL